MIVDVDVLFGQRVEVVDLTAWEAAFEAWLAPKAENTRRAYLQAWNEYKEIAGPAWECGSADVERYVADLRSRGLADSTINQRLSALSSFYRFACERYSPEPGETLHDFNPVLLVDRPRVAEYGESVFLTGEQARAFLETVYDDLSLTGLRNQALFTFYLLTGRRNGEIRLMRRRDLRRASKALWQYRWRGKGAVRWEMAPPPAMSALRQYLEAVDRWETMGPNEWLFTAITSNASRLPNVPQRDPSDNPLSASEVRRLVRRYARLANIHQEGVTVHSLRHTFTTILRDSGFDIGEVQKAVGHASSEVTERYVHSLEGAGDAAAWATVAEVLGLCTDNVDYQYRDSNI